MFHIGRSATVTQTSLVHGTRHENASAARKEARLILSGCTKFVDAASLVRKTYNTPQTSSCNSHCVGHSDLDSDSCLRRDIQSLRGVVFYRHLSLSVCLSVLSTSSNDIRRDANVDLSSRGSELPKLLRARPG